MVSTLCVPTLLVLLNVIHPEDSVGDVQGHHHCGGVGLGDDTLLHVGLVDIFI